MTQPYGQQPDQPGGYPQQAGYPQWAGGLPAAPPDSGHGPVVRPGGTTAAAVLLFVQAGLTIVSAGAFMIALAAIEEGAESFGVDLDAALGEFWVATLAGLTAGGLMIAAGVKALAGSANTMFFAAVVLQLVLCLYWAARIVSLDGSPVWPVLMAVMPIIAIFLMVSADAKRYVAVKSGRPQY